MSTLNEEARCVQRTLAGLRRSVKELEDDPLYVEYCEGIIMAAIAALGLITGDFRNE